MPVGSESGALDLVQTWIVALRTAFTDLLGIRHPIALAPMGGIAGGALAAAVSNGGGLGLLGGGRADREWVERELTILTSSTARPWGVGFLSWAVSPAVLRGALEFGPHVVMLSFGDPGPLVEHVIDAGIPLMLQVTDLAEAKQAVAIGADVIVAQGTEAGGHSGRRATLPFVPIVVDLAAPTPVLAAGGIADGRGVAAALTLGASGSIIGTRFEVTPEALVTPGMTKLIVESTGEDTERSRIFDIARDVQWPSRYQARTIRNAFLDDWREREDEVAGNEGAKATVRDAVASDDTANAPVWASEAIDLINDIMPASDLVELLAREAEDALIGAAETVVPS
jgi:nitronate monooxygenase